MSDMDEKPAKANIQGVEIHLVKINNNRQKPTVPVLAGHKREKELPCRSTPIRVALTSEN